ncbi:MAG TPA: HD-GYP domain-containing protein [Planctomycetota bacterium]|jgi:putative nucleotidyltransferase with HDIG domain|nr:HD-GYP domain-containing protein [Planctomycetota bacterium]
MCDLHREEEQGAQRRGITELVDELTVALMNSRLYARDHPRVQSSITSLLRCVDNLSKDDDSNGLVLGTADGFLFYRAKPLLRASLSSARVIEALKSCGAGGVSIGKEASEQDVMALVDLLAANRKAYAGIQEANVDLARRGSKFIQLLPEYHAEGGGIGPADGNLLAALGDHGVGLEPIPFKVPAALYQQTVTLLQDSAVRVCHGEDIDLDRVRGFVESILGRLAQDSDSMMGLARYERYDAYTFGHSIRVCFLALNFAESLVQREEMLLRIGLAALLHDIGKARVPFEVLHSTTKLSPEERIEMNKHTTHGGEILLGLPEVDPLAVSIAFSHHQTLDGGGYPSTLHTVRQSIGTRIIKICDVYEALTAVRPYKPRMSPVRAYRVMISMKNHFDSALLRRFIEVNGIYPVGSLVKLSTGEQARVVKQTAAPLSPVIRIELDNLGAPLAPDDSPLQDLSGREAGSEPRIVELLEDAA